MKELIERLERAREGSRELDCLIGAELRWPGKCEVICLIIGDGPPSAFKGTWVILRPTTEKYRVTYTEPPYTTSIDAALTLVPEGWLWQASNRAATPHTGRAFLNNGELIYSGMAAARNPKYRYSELTAATPALALCIAALRARQSNG